jgi:hypothetical protein
MSKHAVESDKARNEYERLVLGGLGYDIGQGQGSGGVFQEDGPGNDVWQQIMASRQDGR